MTPAALQVLIAIDHRFTATSDPAELVDICQQWVDLISTSSLAGISTSEDAPEGASLVRRAGTLLCSNMQGSAQALLELLQGAFQKHPGEHDVQTHTCTMQADTETRAFHTHLQSSLCYVRPAEQLSDAHRL